MAILYKDKEEDGFYDEYASGRSNDKGIKGEKLVSDAMITGLSDSFTLLNDVYVRTQEGGYTEIDHILLHEKFIVCIETKNISGELIPIDEETWEKVNFNGESTLIDSPQQQSLHHAISLKRFLKEHKISSYVFAFVVLVNPKASSFNKEADTFYLQECPVIYKNELIHFIKYIESQLENSATIQQQHIAELIIDEHEGIKQSALFWCKKLATHENDPEAQYQLGKMYMMGYFEEDNRLIKVIQNERAALYWYGKAKRQGHALARKDLQLYYKNNR